MDRLKSKLERIFAEHFPGSTSELVKSKPSMKVGGLLIWKGFQRMEQIDRQRRLSAALREGLSSDDRLRVTTILTFTPAESAVMKEEASVNG